MHPTILNGNYDFRLVSLSVLLAMFAAYAALDLAGRVTSSQGRARALWLGCGAAAMGMGIWAMHYVGMLALNMPMPVAYHIPTVIFSLFAAVLASGIALFVVSRSRMGPLQLIAGSIAMGSGIAAMHYIGMAAMRCPAVIVYDSRIVGLSIVLAVVISLVALALAFRVREEKRLSGRKILSALVMGGAIPLMHYTGMWAASFKPASAPPDMTHAVGISTLGVVGVGGLILLVMAGAIASSFFDRLIAAQKTDLDLARERELYFRTMAEAVPQIIWTADLSGSSDYFNQKWIEYTGCTIAQSKGAGWTTTVHPDDLPRCLTKWQEALRANQSYEVEYRLRGRDGAYRWFLVRANPIRNSAGEVIKWFGSDTDIEDQKKNQQTLEAQVSEQTEQLKDANARLKEEMAARELARKQLDQQNERMMAQLTERSRRATSLAQMGELLQSSVNRDEVFAAALGFAPKVFPTAPGAIALLNTSENMLEVVGSWGSCRIPQAAFNPGSCWALRTGHPHMVNPEDCTAPCAHAAGISHSYFCVPILAQGEALGIVHFQTTDAVPEFDASENSFKATFSGQLGLSIANLRLREALRTQSIRDALTGLYNRRYLEEALEREVKRASRSTQSLGLLMIDLDYFKAFNDKYGHEAGDVVLRETAAFLTRGTRAEDFVCRFGGEEFVVLLPTADLEASCARADRLRSKIREMTVTHHGRSLGMVTISVGVATFPQHGLSPRELMLAADAALYRAKHGGRDRVAVADTASVESLGKGVAPTQNSKPVVLEA